MSTILILDDEPLSLRRLSDVLCNGRQHEVHTGTTKQEGVRCIQKLGRKLDLLTIDLSMFQAMAVEVLDLLASACPSAKMLVITPRLRDMGPCAQLRKPFSDDAFLSAVDEMLRMRDGVVVELGPKPRRISGSSRTRHVNTARASK